MARESADNTNNTTGASQRSKTTAAKKPAAKAAATSASTPAQGEAAPQGVSGEEKPKPAAKPRSTAAKKPAAKEGATTAKKPAAKTSAAAKKPAASTTAAKKSTTAAKKPATSSAAKSSTAKKTTTRKSATTSKAAASTAEVKSETTPEVTEAATAEAKTPAKKPAAKSTTTRKTSTAKSTAAKKTTAAAKVDATAETKTEEATAAEVAAEEKPKPAAKPRSTAAKKPAAKRTSTKKPAAAAAKAAPAPKAAEPLPEPEPFWPPEALELLKEDDEPAVEAKAAEPKAKVTAAKAKPAAKPAAKAAAAQPKAAPKKPAVEEPIEEPTASAASEAPAGPAVISAQPGAYGQVKPIQKKRSRKGAVAAILVAAAIVVAAVVAAPHVMDAMKPEQILPSTGTNGPATVLTTSRVSDDLQNMDIQAPDLAAYSYILTDDLIGPRFSLPQIEDMVQTSGSNPVYSQKITTEATYNNKGIRIIVPISMTYTYDAAGETWTHDEPSYGTAETEPLSAASYEAVLADMDLIIRNYEDENFRTLFKAADAKSTATNLTKDGGTMTVALSMQNDTQKASATATVTLTWDSGKGWVAAITEASTPEVAERNILQEAQEQKDEEEKNAEEEAYQQEAKNRPQYHIECTSDDVVQLNGKLSKSGKSYLLTLNDPLRLTLNGKLVYTYTLLLQFGEYDAYSVYKPEDIDPTELVGSNKGFAGTITLTDAGNEAWAEAVDKDREFASEKLVGHTLAVMQVIEVE